MNKKTVGYVIFGIFLIIMAFFIFNFVYDLFYYGGYDEFYTPIKIIKS